jgi:membrane protein implicated in regulation of membrane protease activity
MFDWLGDNAWAAWLSASILLAVAEMASMDLILIMLAAGAVVGMLTAVIGLPVAIQVIAASVTALAALALVRPAMAKRLHGGPELALGHGKLVGKQGVCIERITTHEHGRIKLAGEIWTAEPYDESVVIEVGQTVDVLEIRGATAIVHPIPELP